MLVRLCLLALAALIEANASPSLAQLERFRPDSPILSRSDLRSRPPAHVPIVEPPPGLRFPGNPVPEPGFPQLARSAGIIFSGTVTRIERHSAARGQSLATVAITFHIENAIRGATRGRDLTILQWSGVWSSGQRYRTGERVLLFLYPRSKLGLTSLVAGPMGRFDIDPWNRVVLSARHLSLFRVDPILGGKSRVSFSDFASAVRQACEEE